jgi:hypothetical protein
MLKLRCILRHCGVCASGGGGFKPVPPLNARLAGAAPAKAGGTFYEAVEMVSFSTFYDSVKF